MNGHSVMPLLQDDASTWRAMLHGEHTYHGRGVSESVHFAVTDRDKYIWFSHDGLEQYFDLENDPTECEERVNDASCAPRIAELRDYLVEQLTGREEGFVRDGRLVSGRPTRPILAEAGLSG